ncbi:SPOR domain-containing protein [Escherichia coli]|uniref:SPOR domain-containing protein n=1 Tax=Escherichia coli TaxID=562 RepID=UPI0038B50C0D
MLTDMSVRCHRVCLLYLLCQMFLFSAGDAGAKTETSAVLPAGQSLAEIPPWLHYQAGVAYMNGEGVRQDVVQGRYWIHMAARQGVPLAQYNLGVMFFDGIGGEQNSGCAQWWLQRAQAQQNEDIRSMAEQALSAMVSETKPKVYRIPTMSECDRLPAEYDTEINQPALSVPRADVNVPEVLSLQRVLASLFKWVSGVLHVIRENGLPEWSSGISDQVTELSCEQKDAPGVESVADEVAAAASLPEFSSVLLEEGGHLTDTDPAEAVSSGPSEKEASPKQELLSRASSHAVIARQKTVQNITVPEVPGNNLRTASEKHYTVQLASARTPEGLYASADRYHLTDYLVYETVRHNQRWYVLIAGEYPTQNIARKAIRDLPAEFKRNGAWVRSLRQVQKELSP